MGIGLWPLVVLFWGFCFGWFCLPFGVCLCSFPHHHVVFPFLSMMTWMAFVVEKEAKTAEVGGQPVFKTSKERKRTALPLWEPTRNSLVLMQTVVMSFARGLYLGKAELPIDHVHIYFQDPDSAQALMTSRLKKGRDMNTMWIMLLTTPTILPVLTKDNALQGTDPDGKSLRRRHPGWKLWARRQVHTAGQRTVDHDSRPHFQCLARHGAMKKPYS